MQLAKEVSNLSSKGGTPNLSTKVPRSFTQTLAWEFMKNAGGEDTSSWYGVRDIYIYIYPYTHSPVVPLTHTRRHTTAAFTE